MHRILKRLAAPRRISIRNFSEKNSLLSWLKAYDHRIRTVSQTKIGEDEEGQETAQHPQNVGNAIICAIAAGGLFLAGIFNEFYQYSRFQRIQKESFFKTGIIELTDEKSRPFDQSFPIHK